MNFEQIKELVELFSKENIDTFRLKTDEGFSLKLAKLKTQVLVHAEEKQVAQTPVPAAPMQVAGAPVTESVPPADADVVFITSPIVGTFYRAPNPNAESFVTVGSRVTSGQTLCIVEAMKLMNEIQAEHSCEIVRILVENGEGVEYGQKLFAVRQLG